MKGKVLRADARSRAGKRYPVDSPNHISYKMTEGITEESKRENSMITKWFVTLSFAFFLLMTLSCSSPEDYHIGTIISMSGDMAYYGTEVKRGLDLALEEINMGGGIEGRIIIVHHYDDRSDPVLARKYFKEAIQKHEVEVVIGGISSAVAFELAPIAQEEEVVLLSPTASSPQLTDAGEYFFRIYPSDVVEAQYMAKFTREQLWIKEMAVISVINDYGAGLKKEFILAFERYKGRKLGVFNYNDRAGEEEVSSVVASCLELEPESVYVVGYDYDLVKFIRAIRESGYEGEIVTCARFGSEKLKEELGELGDDIFYPRLQYDPASDRENVRSFVEKFEGKYRYTPGIYAALGYDALMVLKEAIVQAPKYTDDLQRSMSNFGGYRGPTGEISFDTRGNVVKILDIKIRVEGVEKSWEEYEPIYEKRKPFF